MLMHQCNMKRGYVLTQPPGWIPALLSYGNKLNRHTLHWKIPIVAAASTWWFSVEIQSGNQSFRSSVICLADTFTATMHCSTEAQFFICCHCLLVLIFQFSVVFSHSQSGENRSPQWWPLTGKSSIWHWASCIFQAVADQIFALLSLVQYLCFKFKKITSKAQWPLHWMEHSTLGKHWKKDGVTSSTMQYNSSFVTVYF